MKQHQLTKLYFIILTVVFCGLIGVLCHTAFRIEDGKVNKGQIDVSGYNEQAIIRLDGDWIFYPNRLLNMPVEKMSYMNVPGVWQRFDQHKQNKTVYGTYKVKVKLWGKGNYCLRTQFISSACRLYINGEMVLQNGKVALSRKEEVPQWGYHVIPFYAGTDEIEIEIEVSNFHHNKSGILESILLGRQQRVIGYQTCNIIRSSVSVGIFIGFGFYLCVMWHAGSRKKSYYYLSNFCLCAVVLESMLDEGLLFIVLPNLPYEIIMKCQYLTYIGMLFSMILFLGDIFDSRQSMAFKIVSRANFTYILLILLLPSKIYAATDGIYIGFLIINVVFYFIQLIKILKRKVSYEKVLILGVLFVCMTAILEIVGTKAYFNRKLILNNNLYNIGILVFLLCQAYVLCKNIEQTEREAKHGKDMEIAFLQAQISPHFFFNVLNNIYFLLDTDLNLAKWLLINFCNFLRVKHKFDYRKTVFYTLEEEIELVKSYVGIENVRLNQKLEFVLQVEPDILNASVPPLILQPLIENAIKHGFQSEKMVLKITVTKQEDRLYFVVEDTGRGMGKDQIMKLMKMDNQISGVGIKNVNYRLEKCYHTHLQILSEVGRGTQIKFDIPFRTL